MGLRGPTAEFGKRRGAEGQGLEKDSLAGRLEGLAGVTFPGVAGATLPRVRPWASAAEGNLAAGRVARGRKGDDTVLLLRPAGELHIAPVGAHCQIPVEDRSESEISWPWSVASLAIHLFTSTVKPGSLWRMTTSWPTVAATCAIF